LYDQSWILVRLQKAAAVSQFLPLQNLATAHMDPRLAMTLHWFSQLF